MNINNNPSMDALAGINVDEPPIRVKWVDLERVNRGGAKSHCPECGAGTLLVRRDSNTLEILAEDNCILCGQQFIYTDF